MKKFDLKKTVAKARSLDYKKLARDFVYGKPAGERRLGDLYMDKIGLYKHREWRGIKDTVYDFYEWARLWGMLLMSFSKDLIPAMNQTLYYRWMVSYFCCHSFMDKNILGLRGSNLRMSHELTYCIYRYVAENLVILATSGDR